MYSRSSFSSVQFSRSVVPDSATPRTGASTPGLPVHHQLPELFQTHIHWVGDAIQPSHSLSSPSPPAFNLFQHQGLFQWVSSLSISYPPCMGFPGGSLVKNPPADAEPAGDTGSIPGWGRSPGGGNGNPLRYSCLENSVDRGAWWATYSPRGRKESDTI